MSSSSFIEKFKTQLILLLICIIGLVTFAYQNYDKAIEGILWSKSEVETEGKGNQLTSEIKWGIYDYYNLYNDADKFLAEHFYYSWLENNYDAIRRDIEDANERNRSIYLTIEPFAFSALDAEDLLEDIVNGKYDKNIKGMCQLIGEYDDQKIMVAWGHEMESGIGRYPWAVADEDAYIEAYQYFVKECKQQEDNIEYVWAPAGNENAGLYWPGKQYVDVIGLSVYSFAELEMDEFGRTLEFDELFRPAYDNVKGFYKPIIISEFGVTGDNIHKNSWFVDAVKSMEAYDSLKYVFLFNANDSKGAWPDKYEVPEWYIDADMYAEIPRN